MPDFTCGEKVAERSWCSEHVAVEHTSGQRVRLILLDEELSRDELLPLRLERDWFRWVSLVRDPNVLAVHEFGRAGSRVYFTIEWFDGHPLHLGRPWPRDEALLLVAQLCRGLAAIHGHQLVVRDLGPQRILIGALAKIVLDPEWMFQSDPARALTPEESLGKPISLRTDLHSLAAISFELLAGFPPWDRGNSPALLLTRLTEPPRRIGPPALDAFMQRALAVDPQRRPPDAMTFLAELERAVE
jgi:serine/threonine-protein kinase